MEDRYGSSGRLWLMSIKYDPSLHRWEPMSIVDVRPLLDDPRVRVWLSGGVGLDVWLGYGSRDHGDIDLSVLRADWRPFARRLPKRLIPHAAENGYLRPIGDDADPPANVWCLDADTGAWVLQVNLEDGDDHRWIYRRHPAIARPWHLAVVSIGDTSVVAPEVQLLWKSKNPTAKDEADLARVVPTLEPAAKTWLVNAIRAAHPESPWTRALPSARAH